MEEKRITNRLKSYWDTLRKDLPYPDIHRFNIEAVEDLWPFCFQVKVSKHSPPQFIYEYMGEELVKLYGHDLTDVIVDMRAAHFPGSVLHQRLENVIQSAKPMADQGHMLNFNGELIRYRACMLPFGTERDGLTHIVCGLSYRYFE